MIVFYKLLEKCKYDWLIIINKIRGLGTVFNAVNLRDFYHGCTRISTDKMPAERKFIFSLSILSKLLGVITIRVHQCLHIRYASLEAATQCKSVVSLLFFTTFTLVAIPIFSEEKEKTNKEFLEENTKKVQEKNDRIYELEKNSKDRREEPEFITKGRNANFLVVGGSLGSPSSVNLNVGYYYDRFVIRGSGGYINQHWNGMQGDIGYSFYKTPEVIMGISIVSGMFKNSPFDPQTGAGGQNKYRRFDFPGYENQPQTQSDIIIRSLIASQNQDLSTLLEYKYRSRQEAHFSQNYTGLALDFYLDGFFLQLGMGAGSGSYRNPQLLMQVGYLFDFGKNK
jgi:hypothetical protein